MKTLELDRSYYTAHFYIAEILEKQGKEKQALEEYEWFLGADVKDAKMMKKAQDKVIKLGQKILLNERLKHYGKYGKD